MSLTASDLQEIRTIVRETIREELKPLEGRLEALESDVREIYFMISRLEKGVITDRSFSKLSLQDKLLRLNAELLAAAKQAGVTLPR